MKKLVCSAVIAIFLFYAAIDLFLAGTPIVKTYDGYLPTIAIDTAKTSEEMLFRFVEKNLVEPDGSIPTNLRRNGAERDTVSESVGLLMNYCVLSGKKDLFDREVSFLKNRMITEGKYIRWRVGITDAGCNAAIDDLRIICALLDAYDKWGVREYYDLAGFLQEGIYDRQVSGRDLYELYEWKTGKSRHSIPLCYLDLYTVDRISDFNKGWLAVEEKGLSTVLNGRINDSSPFYFKYYNYDTGGYSFDEEYRKDGGICLTYTLYTALHMAQVNEENTFLTEWLKKEIKSGKLYAWYNPHTLKPANSLESTAVYALAAIYAQKTGEKELYDELISSMSRFMVSEKLSKYYGGFGDPASRSFYSFDNLTALWAFALPAE